MAMQKFGQIAHVSQERLDRMDAKTVARELRDILDAEQEMSTDPSVSAMSHQHNMAEAVSAAAPSRDAGVGGNRIASHTHTSKYHVFNNHFSC